MVPSVTRKTGIDVLVGSRAGRGTASLTYGGHALARRLGLRTAMRPPELGLRVRLHGPLNCGIEDLPRKLGNRNPRSSQAATRIWDERCKPYRPLHRQQKALLVHVSDIRPEEVLEGRVQNAPHVTRRQVFCSGGDECRSPFGSHT